jgi:hypothetical protein
MEVVSRGTFQLKDNTLHGYEPKFILAYLRHGEDIGVTFFDITTATLHIG